MGKIRIKEIKHAAFKLVKEFPDKWTTDFEKNKKIANTLNIFPTKKTRNKVIGYLTTVMKRQK